MLQAAIEAGLEVPYYCYHPALGVDGSCRVCLVKIEKMAKLQVSCSITATEGMVVHTATPDVIEGRAGVFEFLLINHPLDCPVCDKGGECPLQDFSYQFGRDQSRMEFPRRVFDGEGVKADVDFGPTLMLNRNRCILCTRCIRFMREVEGDAQIGVVNRGYGSAIATYADEGVHSLLSGNLMDVCPVGAITTRDYRFKSRPWDNPSAVDTICTLCERGCNTTAWLRAKPEWAKGAQLVRMTPRLNAEVNGYWMCDIGRFEYHWVEGEERLTQPMVRGASGGPVATSWDSALVAAAAVLRKPAHGPGPRFLLSAHGSHEELYVAARLAQHLLDDAAPSSVDVAWTSSVKPQPASTKFPVPPVDAPNLAGARLLGLTSSQASGTSADLSALRHAVESGQVSALFVHDPDPWARSATSPGSSPHASPARFPGSSSSAWSGRRWSKSRTSCWRARAGSKRTRATRTHRDGCSLPRGSSRRPAKPSRTPRSCCAWRRRSVRTSPSRAPMPSARTSWRSSARRPALPASMPSSFPGWPRHSTGCRRRTPWSGRSGTRCSATSCPSSSPTHWSASRSEK